MSDQSDRAFLLGHDHHYNNRRIGSNLKNFSAEFQRRNSSKCLPSLFKRRRGFRSFAIGIVFLFLILVLTMFYFDPNLKTFRRNNLEKSQQQRHRLLAAENSEILESSQFVGYESILQDNFSFNINGSDVMVFLHIQKTGGTTFGKHLVQDIDLEAPCICHRKSGKKRNPKKPAKKMLSTGWKCGLHADWTELTECVDGYLNSKEGNKARRYFYVSILRDPVERYLSEFRHVQRGATWKGSKHLCHGEPVSKTQVPPCYDEEKGIWENVSLKEFMDCPSNWAANRQTRMLADLRLVDCYNMTAMTRENRDKAILESAKNNLEQLAFFGLTEFQNVTQYMFEETFNLNFRVKFEQTSSETDKKVSPEVMDQIRSINKLDIELYDFAKKLLLMRFESAKSADNVFEEHFEHAKNKVFNFHEIIEDENDYEY